MPQLEAGKYYDAVVVPSECGFFRKKKADGSTGELYFRLQLQCEDGQQFPYPWYVSGKMAESLRDALPSMGVPKTALQDRRFYEKASEFVKPVPCQFGVKEEEYQGELRLKIKGVYFNPPQAATADDVDVLMSRLCGGAIDDDVPF